jgi:hypothetical protein
MVPLTVHAGSSTDPVTQPGVVTAPVTVHSDSSGCPLTPIQPVAVHGENVAVIPILEYSLISPSAVHFGKVTEPLKRDISTDGESEGLSDADGLKEDDGDSDGDSDGLKEDDGDSEGLSDGEIDGESDGLNEAPR